ncbi:hypothetical protein DPMN_147104 [Dreissena polymorpha]|uniref:Uncharacterized protein n=1 Tax=Dreissena polymorpha TaxID=45954 RepID=A0A9D4FBK5_DREPO|nr:hypothetical protein DPMN_147104 [Dreissena polymorpha]
MMCFQIGDETGQVTAQMNLADLKSVLGSKVGPDEGHRPSPLDHLDVGMCMLYLFNNSHSGKTGLNAHA